MSCWQCSAKIELFAPINKVYTMQSVYSFHYTDCNSAGNSAYNDLAISRDRLVCGSNKAKARLGDICTISAKRGDHMNFIVGEITEELGENYPAWTEHGGLLWKYNFRFRPLTHQISADTDAGEFGILRELCDKESLNFPEKKIKFAQLFNPNPMAGGVNKTKFLNVWTAYLASSKFRIQ